MHAWPICGRTLTDSDIFDGRMEKTVKRLPLPRIAIHKEQHTIRICNG